MIVTTVGRRREAARRTAVGALAGVMLLPVTPSAALGAPVPSTVPVATVPAATVPAATGPDVGRGGPAADVTVRTRERAPGGSAAVVPAGTAGVAAGAAASSTDVVLVGHGWGHGRGMGQWGAYGYAVDYGWTSSMILDHYYGGTRRGDIGNPGISVRLSSIDAHTGTWVTSAHDFAIGTRTVAAGSAARVVRSGSSWRVYTSYGGCSADDNYGPWTVSDPTARLAPGAPSGATLVICANDHGYKGTLKWAMDGSAVRLVNTLPMEEYLRGVVPSESIASWGDDRGGLGMAALEAQAVAARSYAWSENRYPYARTCDTTSCQVYSGSTYDGRSTADSRTDRAIRNTAGDVRVDRDGRTVRTEFSASTGGYTEPGLWPGVVDLGDWRSPRHTWTVRLSGTRLASYYGVGSFVRFSVARQNGLGLGGGRVELVRVWGTSGMREISASSFTSTWGLYNDWFFPAEQARQQVDDLDFVRVRYSPYVYRQFTLESNGWTDHGYVSASDYAASGRPPVARKATSYVKVRWSPAVFGVTTWPTEPRPRVDWLTPEQYASVGRPPVRVVPSVPGTVYWQEPGDKKVFALGPDDSVHHLSYAEWVAAGRPTPVRRTMPSALTDR